MVIAAGVLSFGYLLNALWDRDGDLDAAKNPFVGHAELTRRGLRGAAVLGVSTIVLSGLTSGVSLVATVVAMGSGVLYSTGVRIKAVPYAGTLFNAACFAPLLAVGCEGAPPPGFAALVAVFTALLLQNQLLHEAADAEEDRRAGWRTTFSTLGPKGTAVLAALLGAAIPCACWVRGGWLAGVWIAPSALVFTLAVPLVLARDGQRRAVMSKARVAHRWLSFAAGAFLFLSGRLTSMS